MHTFTAAKIDLQVLEKQKKHGSLLKRKMVVHAESALHPKNAFKGKVLVWKKAAAGIVNGTLKGVPHQFPTPNAA